MKAFSFTEKSGVTIQELSGGFQYSSQLLLANNFLLTPPNTSIGNTIEIKHPNILEIAESLEKADLNIKLIDSYLGMTDIALLAPDIATEPAFQQIKRSNIYVNGLVNGSVGNLNIPKLDIRGLNGTALVAGFIESFYSYVGHLGVDRELLNEGENEFQPVDKVVNSGGNFVDAPQFMKVYAGAGAPGDSRNMHSLLIDTSGNVYTAGNNHKGQLCFDDLQSRDVFERVSGLPNAAVAAAVGLDFTLILLSDGKVYGCGSNENGELGLGPNISSTGTPSGNGLSNIVEVSAGLNFGLYLQKIFNEVEGKVFGSGSNLFSQLCESTEGDPVVVPKVRK